MHSLKAAKAPRVVFPPCSKETGIPNFPNSSLEAPLAPATGLEASQEKPPKKSAVISALVLVWAVHLLCAAPTVP